MLALIKRVKSKEYELTLAPGERIFVYTDGIPEAIDEETRAYGTDRLTDVLNETRQLPVEDSLSRILEDIRVFAGGAEQFDDITMLGFEYIGPKPDDR